MKNKFFDKYKSISAPAKATLWFTVMNILQKGIAFITVPIFTRMMTTEQYGIYTLYISWREIFLIFTSLSLYLASFNRALIRFKDDRDELISSWIGLTTVLTISVFTVYLIFQKKLCEITSLSMPVMSALFLELLFYPALAFWMAKERFDFKYRKLVFVTVCIAVLNPLIGIVAVKITEYKAEARILTCVVVNVCAGLIFYVMFLKKGKKFYHQEYWRYALTLNLPLIPHYLSSIILNQIDRIMINYFFDSGKAAVYSVAYSISMTMTIITGAVGSTMTPWLYQSLNDNRYDTVKKITNKLLILIMTMVFLLVLFAPEAVYIMGGSEYSEATNIIPFVASSVFFTFLYSRFADVEFYFEKTKAVMVASVLSAVSNLILNWMFIPKFGFVAAGATTLVCYILYSLFHGLFMVKITRNNHINSLYDYKTICLYSFFMILISMFARVLYSTTILRYLLIIFIIMVFMWKKQKIIDMIKMK